MVLPLLPMKLPAGVDPEDHIGRECPADLFDDPDIAEALAIWADWSFFGEASLPFPGSLLDQPAKLVEALRVLSQTAQLQRAYHAESAKLRADQGG